MNDSKRQAAQAEGATSEIESFESAFSVRARKLLQRLGVTSRAELMSLPFEKLINGQNCGPTTIAELAEFCIGRDPRRFLTRHMKKRTK